MPPPGIFTGNLITFNTCSGVFVAGNEGVIVKLVEVTRTRLLGNQDFEYKLADDLFCYLFS